MPEIRFNYRKFPTNPPLELPLIPVTLIHGNHCTPSPIELMLDSGAQNCLIKSHFGRLLGIDVRRGRSCPTSGFDGKPQQGWMHDIELDVQGRRFTCSVIFADIAVPGVLGRDGFFDRFTVVFEHRRRRFTLKYRERDLR